MHYYPGLTVEAIREMTHDQYRARIADVNEIESMKSGKGKGRITREPLERLQDRAAKVGLRPPKRRAGG
jgi:hypothetical protein